MLACLLSAVSQRHPKRKGHRDSTPGSCSSHAPSACLPVSVEGFSKVVRSRNDPRLKLLCSLAVLAQFLFEIVIGFVLAVLASLDSTIDFTAIFLLWCGHSRPCASGPTNQSGLRLLPLDGSFD